MGICREVAFVSIIHIQSEFGFSFFENFIKNVHFSAKTQLLKILERKIITVLCLEFCFLKLIVAAWVRAAENKSGKPFKLMDHGIKPRKIDRFWKKLLLIRKRTTENHAVFLLFPNFPFHSKNMHSKSKAENWVFACPTIYCPDLRLLCYIALVSN